jgi:hypothetical protein
MPDPVHRCPPLFIMRQVELRCDMIRHEMASLVFADESLMSSAIKSFSLTEDVGRLSVARTPPVWCAIRASQAEMARAQLQRHPLCRSAGRRATLASPQPVTAWQPAGDAGATGRSTHDAATNAWLTVEATAHPSASSSGADTVDPRQKPATHATGLAPQFEGCLHLDRRLSAG